MFFFFAARKTANKAKYQKTVTFNILLFTFQFTVLTNTWLLSNSTVMEIFQCSKAFTFSARGHLVELKNSILKFLCFIIHSNNFYKSTLSSIQGVESSVAK